MTQLLPRIGILIEKIQALLAKANHPNTPLPEAESALAIASRLMQKHGYTDADIAGGGVESHDVAVERVVVSGKYRVQRVNLLFAIAMRHSCVGYRDDDEGDGCVLVVYGREVDIRAARVLFAAAEMLALRTMPTGSRSFRTQWWKGFRIGIEDSLGKARDEFIFSEPGSGLVLADRLTRARNELRSTGPKLRSSYVSVDASGQAFVDGREAGRRFGTSGRSFTSGVRGELT